MWELVFQWGDLILNNKVMIQNKVLIMDEEVQELVVKCVEIKQNCDVLFLKGLDVGVELNFNNWLKFK